MMRNDRREKSHIFSENMSDSSYAKTRFYYTHGSASYAHPSRPLNIDLVDDDWARDALSDDDVDVNITNGTPTSLAVHEALLQFQREEEALEGEHTGVFGGNLSGKNVPEDLQWNDLGLDELQSELALTSIGGVLNEARASTGDEQQQQQQPNSSNAQEGEGQGEGEGEEEEFDEDDEA